MSFLPPPPPPPDGPYMPGPPHGPPPRLTLYILPTVNQYIVFALIHTFSNAILLAQVRVYFKQFRGDKLRLKFLVGAVLLFATMQTIVVIFTLYALVNSYHSIALGQVGTFVNATLTGIIQPYYLWRAYKLTKQAIFSSILAFLYILSKSTSIISCVLIVGKHLSVAEGNNTIRALTLSWTGIAIILELGLTTQLLLYFRKSRKGGLLHMTAALDRLAMLTWTTAAPPGVMLVIAFALTISKKTNSYAAIFAYLTGKLYSHALLITLNFRGEFREQVLQITADLKEVDLRQMGVIGLPRPHSFAQAGQTIYTLNSQDTQIEEQQRSLTTTTESPSSELGEMSYSRPSMNYQTLMEALRDDDGHCGACGSTFNVSRYQGRRPTIASDITVTMPTPVLLESPKFRGTEVGLISDPDDHLHP